MTKPVNTIEQAAALRRRAEDMALRQAGPPPSDPESTLPAWAVQRLQELRGHKSDLELENMELRRTRQHLDEVGRSGVLRPHLESLVRLIPKQEWDSDQSMGRRVLNEWV